MTAKSFPFKSARLLGFFFFAINPICCKLLRAILLNIWQAFMPHIHFSGERLHLVVPFVKYFLIGRKKLQQSKFILIAFPNYQ